ncbi:hypothetical protein KY332_05345 [Candidatus Woesearchaeota archaeon]|nr:hypothetical protein [Candidatus Woesearchaeota archaeon]
MKTLPDGKIIWYLEDVTEFLNKLIDKYKLGYDKIKKHKADEPKPYKAPLGKNSKGEDMFLESSITEKYFWTLGEIKIDYFIIKKKFKISTNGYSLKPIEDYEEAFSAIEKLVQSTIQDNQLYCHKT